MTRRLRVVSASYGRGLAIAAVVAVLWSTPAAALSAGKARLTRQDEVTALSSGGSATPYALVLPEGAHCPGDTAHKGYRVWSYLVPKGTDMASVSFVNSLPNPGYGFVAEGEFFGARNTAEGTGQVIGLPNDFVFTRLTAPMVLPHGAQSATWDGGIACSTVHGQMSAYWNVEFVFAASSADPGGFTWTVTHPIVLAKPGRSWGRLILAGALAVAGVGLGVKLWPRRQRRLSDGAPER
jgi:hypothetical protein